MAKNRTTLLDFVKTYLSNMEKTNTKESYEGWLKKNGIDAEGIYSSEMRNAATQKAKLDSGYGSRAESLASAGLQRSGYSDYLKSIANKSALTDKAKAESSLYSNTQKNLSGYADYVNKFDQEERKNYKSAVSSISSDGILNLDEAYKLALSFGLTEDRANEAAKEATDSVRRNVIESVTKDIVRYTFSEGEAWEYAKSLGLSDSDAKALSEYAHRINELIYSSDYDDEKEDFTKVEKPKKTKKKTSYKVEMK